MPHAYTEDQFVEQPAIGLFAELGWQGVAQIHNLSRTRDPVRAKRVVPATTGECSTAASTDRAGAKSRPCWIQRPMTAVSVATPRSCVKREFMMAPG